MFHVELQHISSVNSVFQIMSTASICEGEKFVVYILKTVSVYLLLMTTTLFCLDVYSVYSYSKSHWV